MQMTPAQECKSYGIKSLTVAAELTGWSTKALGEWHKSNPQRFRIIMQGLAIELGQDEEFVRVSEQSKIELIRAELQHLYDEDECGGSDGFLGVHKALSIIDRISKE